MKMVVIIGAILSTALFAAPIEMPLPKNVKIINVGQNEKIKTLEDALAQVVEIRKTDTKTPLALCMAPGDYAPAKQITITKEMAALNMGRLYIYAKDFENRPHIHGGHPIKNWKKVKFNGHDNVWCADVSYDKDLKRPRLLFFNGKRMQPARWPNFDKMRPYNTGYSFAKQDKSAKFYQDEIVMCDEDIRKWAHPEDGWAIINPEHNYWQSFHEVTGISNNIIRLEAKHNQLGGYNKWDRYCVENIAEELDAKGEWYYNPREKKVYLISPDETDPNNAVVTFPLPGTLLTAKGKEVGNFTLAGLEFSGGNECIRIYDSSKIDILGCSIHDFGFYGFGGCHLGIGIFIMAPEVRVMDCDIHNIGNHGVMVHSYGTNKVDYRQNVVIENNYIHHCGEVDPSGNAIRNAGQGVKVSHNLMHDFPRSAICGYGRMSEISYNRIRHCNMTGDDTGAMYDAAWTSCVGTKICYNWISDSIGYKRTGHKQYTFFWGACGIYMDECSGGLEVYGNLIHDCHWAAMHLHNGRWSTISNNVFVSNATPHSMYSHQLSLQSWDRKGFQGGRRNMYSSEYKNFVKHDPRWLKFPALAQNPETDEVFSDDKNGTMMMGLKIVNNIFYYPNQGFSGSAMMIYDFNLKTNTINNNIYRDDKRTKWSIYYGAGEVEGWFVRGGWRNWEKWQEFGGDRNSIIDDPLFVNPGKKDYRLKPESPAFKMGFKELPYDQMGLKKTHFRPELPKEAEGLREHPEWLRKPSYK